MESLWADKKINIAINNNVLIQNVIRVVPLVSDNFAIATECWVPARPKGFQTEKAVVDDLQVLSKQYKNITIITTPLRYFVSLLLCHLIAFFSQQQYYFIFFIFTLYSMSGSALKIMPK